MWHLDQRGMQANITKINSVEDVHSFLRLHVLTPEVLEAHRENLRQKYQDEINIDAAIKDIVTENEIKLWVGKMMDAGTSRIGAAKMKGLRHRFGSLMEVLMWAAVGAHSLE